MSFVSSPLVDRYGRTVRYLRLSITDRCNFRCLYCQSPARTSFIPHANILQYEEFLRLTSIAVSLGVEKVRITGGEPFARKGAADFLFMLRQRFPDLDLRITSNGSLLAEQVPLLKKLKVRCVNLSLDSFDTETFAKITGRDQLKNVLATLDALLCCGVPVKLNAVALKGVTQESLDDFLHAARSMAIDVRFIEFMPMGENTVWNSSNFCSVQDILTMAKEKVELIPVSGGLATDGPARMYRIGGSSGRLGFISPISSHFCHSCNRLRLTSEGALRLCLFDDREYALRPLLRDPTLDDRAIADVIVSACQKKPLGADVLAARKETAVARRKMSGIGG